MKNYSRQEILDLIEETAREAGFIKWNEGQNDETEIYKEGIAVLQAESNLNPIAMNMNEDNSIDIGICQWNSDWHCTNEIKKNHPDEYIHPKDALDPEKALKLFWKIFPKRPECWTTYRNKKYLQFLKS